MNLTLLFGKIVECLMEINMLMYCYICDNYYSAPRDLHHLRQQSWLVQRWPNVGTTVPTLGHRWATPVTLRDKTFGAHQCTDFLLTLFSLFSSRTKRIKSSWRSCNCSAPRPPRRSHISVKTLWLTTMKGGATLTWLPSLWRTMM